MNKVDGNYVVELKFRQIQNEIERDNIIQSFEGQTPEVFGKFVDTETFEPMIAFTYVPFDDTGVANRLKYVASYDLCPPNVLKTDSPSVWSRLKKVFGL